MWEVLIRFGVELRATVGTAKVCPCALVHLYGVSYSRGWQFKEITSAVEPDLKYQ